MDHFYSGGDMHAHNISEHSSKVTSPDNNTYHHPHTYNDSKEQYPDTSNNHNEGGHIEHSHEYYGDEEIGDCENKEKNKDIEISRDEEEIVGNKEEEVIQNIVEDVDIKSKK